VCTLSAIATTSSRGGRRLTAEHLGEARAGHVDGEVCAGAGLGVGHEAGAQGVVAGQSLQGVHEACRIGVVDDEAAVVAPAVLRDERIRRRVDEDRAAGGQVLAELHRCRRADDLGVLRAEGQRQEEHVGPLLRGGDGRGVEVALDDEWPLQPALAQLARRLPAMHVQRPGGGLRPLQGGEQVGDRVDVGIVDRSRVDDPQAVGAGRRARPRGKQVEREVRRVVDDR